MTTRRAFVTGSTGLLGNNLVAILLDRGWEVVAMARSVDKARSQLGENAALTVVQGDLEELEVVLPHLEGVDVVFHTAAYFREYYGRGDHEAKLHALNVEAPVVLARAAAARGVGVFVHTSSSGTLAEGTDGGPATEADQAEPEDADNLYFRSKVLADRALAAQDLGAMRLVTAHPGWMFGPGDAGPTSAGRLVLNFLSGELPPFALPGGASVADARDVASAMVRMAEVGEPGEHFVVAGQPATLRQILDQIAAAAGRNGPRFTLPGPLAFGLAAAMEATARITGADPLITVRAVRTLQRRPSISSAHAEGRLGVTWRPLAETMQDTVAWLQATLARNAALCTVSRVA